MESKEEREDPIPMSTQAHQDSSEEDGTAAAEIADAAKTPKPKKKGGRKRGGRGRGGIPLDLSLLDEASRPKRERRSVQPRDVEEEERWHYDEKEKLLDALHRHSHLAYESISHAVKTKTPEQVEKFIQKKINSSYLTYKTRIVEADPEKGAAPLELWLSLLQELTTTHKKMEHSRHYTEIMRLIGQNEPMPEDSGFVDLDWRHLYQFISDLLADKAILQPLTNMESLVVLDMMHSMGDTLHTSDTRQQRRLLDLKYQLFQWQVQHTKDRNYQATSSAIRNDFSKVDYTIKQPDADGDTGKIIIPASSSSTPSASGSSSSMPSFHTQQQPSTSSSSSSGLIISAPQTFSSSSSIEILEKNSNNIHQEATNKTTESNVTTEQQESTTTSTTSTTTSSIPSSSSAALNANDTFAATSSSSSSSSSSNSADITTPSPIHITTTGPQSSKSVVLVEAKDGDSTITTNTTNSATTPFSSSSSSSSKHGLDSKTSNQNNNNDNNSDDHPRVNDKNDDEVKEENEEEEFSDPLPKMFSLNPFTIPPSLLYLHPKKLPEFDTPIVIGKKE